MKGILDRENIPNTREGMWGRRKRSGEEGEGEHFYPLQHPKDRSVNRDEDGSLVEKVPDKECFCKTGKMRKSWPPSSPRETTGNGYCSGRTGPSGGTPR